MITVSIWFYVLSCLFGFPVFCVVIAFLVYVFKFIIEVIKQTIKDTIKDLESL